MPAPGAGHVRCGRTPEEAMMMYRELDPDDLDGIYRYLLTTEVVDGPEELRDIVRENWPELLHKIKPPRWRMH
jgi:hypothetical protein